MTQIKIDKGVPIPTKKGRSGSGKYPFSQLDVGDSFFTESKQRLAYASSIAYGKRHNKKFTTRSENGGTRVWRIA